MSCNAVAIRKKTLVSEGGVTQHQRAPTLMADQYLVPRKSHINFVSIIDAFRNIQLFLTNTFNEQIVFLYTIFLFFCTCTHSFFSICTWTVHLLVIRVLWTTCPNASLWTINHFLFLVSLFYTYGWFILFCYQTISGQIRHSYAQNTSFPVIITIFQMRKKK